MKNIKYLFNFIITPLIRLFFTKFIHYNTIVIQKKNTVPTVILLEKTK